MRFKRFFVRYFFLLTAGMFLGGLLGQPLAWSDEKDEKIEERTVTGEIVTVGKNAISVEFAKTHALVEEMLLPLDSNVKVEGPKKLAQLQPGDHVSVHYRQTYRDDKEKGGRVILKTVATKIVLLHSALPEGTLRSSETGAPR